MPSARRGRPPSLSAPHAGFAITSRTLSSAERRSSWAWIAFNIRATSAPHPNDREAITLCDLEGLPQDEYARRKGLSLPGAKSRIQRARKRLRERLSQGCQVRLDAAGQVRDFVPRPPLA